MLDWLWPCVEAQFVLLVLGFLNRGCHLVDRFLYWASRRTKGRIRRFFVGLEYRWFIWPWFPIQELIRNWEKKLKSELLQIQIE